MHWPVYAIKRAPQFLHPIPQTEMPKPHLQKQFQSDQLTLVSMKTRIAAILNGMQNINIPGGFKSKLAKKLVVEEDNNKSDKIDSRSPYICDDKANIPITPTPPNTPRTKTKGILPTAMTVSVTKSTTQSGTVISTTTTSSTTTKTCVTNAMMALTMGRPTSPNNSSGSDNDGLVGTSGGTASATALRRLYFKSGRSSKTRVPVTTSMTAFFTSAPSSSASGVSGGGVPKLVLMGSSTASTTETTINTSTESASTLVTSVTATDTSDNCDSLDMGDTSGQSEPLLSSLDEPSTTGFLNDSEHEITEMELTSSAFSRPDISLLENFENEESSLSIQIANTSRTVARTQNIPRTAPIQSGSVHFLFDTPPSPKSVRTIEKNKSLFTFKEANNYIEEQKLKQDEDTKKYIDKYQQQKQQQQQTQKSQQSHNNTTNQSSSGACNENRNSVSKSHQNQNHQFEQQKQELSSQSQSPQVSRQRKYEVNEMTPKRWDRDDDKENNKKIKESTLSNFPPFHEPINLDANSFSSNTADFDEACKKSHRNNSFKMKSNNRFVNTVRTSPKKSKYGAGNNNGNRSGGKINSAPAIAGRGHHQYQNKGKHSATYDQKDLTMFPFDREAIDYERIQRECFAVDETVSGFQHTNGDDGSSTSTDTDDNDLSVYERKPYMGSPSKGAKNDIFKQYTLLSQQESYNSNETRNSKRSRPDLIHSKYDHITKSDAFSPKPNDQMLSSTSPKYHSDVHKFDQIANKFEQIPSKFMSGGPSAENLQSSNYYHQKQFNDSNTNLSNSSCYKTNRSPTDSTRIPSPLPDLRIDFFSEPKTELALTATVVSRHNHHHQLHSVPNSHFLEHNFSQLPVDEQQQHQHHHNHHQQPHDCLDESQKSSQSTATGGPINVTPNPMESAVCTQPRATIVVQQPSLSLDSTVETLLLKNESDYISVEETKENRRKRSSHYQPNENMRQLLDVTNTLTFEELRDFEMRYGSPHHNRSQSVKTPGSRSSGRPNQLTLPQQRSRVASMPSTGVEEEYYRLRHFSITGKGVVNRGDSLKSRRSRSNNSVASSNSSTEHLTTTQIPLTVNNSARTSATCSLASSRESSTSNPGSGPYRVLMLGGSAVGKSSIVSQFMTSEYLHAYDTSIDDESGEKSVSVLLNGEESELIFIDHAYSEISPENCLSSYDPHGYCVIYSSADRSSFVIAERILQALWTNENIAQKAVILVGNKADLARSRICTADEGKAMATAYDCKFIETSVGINHNVDELLVGLLSQIRLKLENPEKSRDLFRKRSTRKSKRRACSPLGGACLTGNGGTNPSTPLGQPNSTIITDMNTPPGSAHSSPRKYRGSRTSASLKVKGLLGRVWARDSKSKSCENLHVL